MPAAKNHPYLVSFAGFTPNPNACIEEEFKRLAKHRRWRPGSDKYKEERGKCLLSEFDVHVGSTLAEGRLSSWRSLCIEVGIYQPPETIKECKKVYGANSKLLQSPTHDLHQVLSKVFVNLVDLIDSRRRGTKVSTFRNVNALREYTIRTHKTFPKQKAKQDGVLKILLREIY